MRAYCPSGSPMPGLSVEPDVNDDFTRSIVRVNIFFCLTAQKINETICSTWRKTMNLKTYLDTVENANKLAKRAGIATSIIYRALHGSDIKLTTAKKIVDASGNRIDYAELAIERDSPSPTLDGPGSAKP